MFFKKMHGCGNDFILIYFEQNLNYVDLAIKLCDRKFGIGADGLIIVKKDPLEMIFYNSDGTRASMCGNGIRCFAKFCFEEKVVSVKKFEVLTQAGIMKVQIVKEDPFLVKVQMGEPLFQNAMIHVSDTVSSFGRILTVGNYHLTIYSFFMATVHTVIFVDSLSSEVLNFAEQICNHPLFKKKTNVNFVHILNQEHIEVKTYERGVGWTLACGTGACASVVTTHKLGLTTDKVEVNLPKGILEIEYHKNQVFMTGPAVCVFSGNYLEETKC